MVDPVNQRGKIARHMIAVRLPGTCRVEVQTGVHVDDSGLKSGQRDVAWMRQHIAPIGECSDRSRKRRDLEPVESPTQQIGRHGATGQNQDGGRESESLESPHHGSCGSQRVPVAQPCARFRRILPRSLYFLRAYGAIITFSKYGKRYEAGLYPVGSSHMHVTCGVGLEGGIAPRVRFFARPGITVVDLAPR
jgi:hypothetical protein